MHRRNKHNTYHCGVSTQCRFCFEMGIAFCTYLSTIVRSGFAVHCFNMVIPAQVGYLVRTHLSTLLSRRELNKWIKNSPRFWGCELLTTILHRARNVRWRTHSPCGLHTKKKNQLSMKFLHRSQYILMVYPSTDSTLLENAVQYITYLYLADTP